ncbi:MAG: hypothetical protein KDK62_00255 [Chlamydiia bacterium]|nr:hypothetical protein [Chlamydiia bacterium]
MFKDSTYQEKLKALKPFSENIVDLIKRDLKNEHLKKDNVFVKKYFPGKVPNRISVSEMAEGYFLAIQDEEVGEKVAEFIANRWMLKSSDLYGYFESELIKVTDDFEAIEELDESLAQKLLEGAQEEYGAISTYLFSVINSVAFSKERFDALSKQALKEKKELSHAEEEKTEADTIESLKRDLERKMLRLEDKYEKKLEGLQKKYLRDTEMLKKQIANLQRKLNA